MAASLALTALYSTGQLQQIPNRVVLAWTSASDGSVAISTDSATGANVHGVFGVLLKVQFIPGSGGTQPTNAYSVTLTDTAGIDVLAGQGASLSNTTATAIIPGVPLKDGTTTSTAPCVVAEALTLNVSNAGSGKTGSVVLYLR